MPRVTTDPLTDAEVKAKQPGPIPIDVRDGGARGLILTILPSGRKQWSVRYRSQGRQRRLTLGDYPTLTLSKARIAADEARHEVRNGVDVAAVRRAAHAQPTDTIETLVDDYLKKHAERKKRSAKEDRRVLHKYVLPKWEARSVSSIRRRDVVNLVEAIAERGAPIMANRVLEIVRKMFNWAIKNNWDDIIDANPAARIDKPGVEKARDRVLSDDEVRALWSLLSRFPSTTEKQAPGRKRAKTGKDGAFSPLSPTLSTVQKFRLVTAQRGGEVIRMRWQDVDLEAAWWTIPAEHSKNKQPHRVPLTHAAVELIKAQIPKDAKVDSLQGEVFVSRDGGSVADRAKKAGAACSKALGFEMRSHDLRRTAATRMAEAKIPREHISHVLNHVIPGPASTRVYDRYQYDAEKRLALEAWERRLDTILSGKKTDNVVTITKKRV